MMIMLILVCALFVMLWLPLNDGAPSNDNTIATIPSLDALTITTALTLASTAYVLDSILVQAYAGGVWRVDLTKGIAKRSMIVSLEHDGSHTSAATTPSWTIEGGAPIGTCDFTISATLTGSGATQALNLVATASSTGWTAGVLRIPLAKIPQ